MIPKLILQTFGLPLKKVKIGSLITDPLHPNEDIQNGSTSLNLEKDCSISRTGRRLETENKSSNTSIVFQWLGHLFGSWKSSSTSVQTIVADDTCTYELNKPSDRFKDLTSQEDVQSWIQVQVEEGNPIYLVTGIQTTLNQHLEASQNFNKAGSASVPLNPNPDLTSNLVNADDSMSGIRLSYSQSDNRERSLAPKGELIVAIRVRRVIVQNASPAAFEASLDQKNKCMWKMVGDNRGETLVEQLVEAVLEEEDDDCGGTTEILSTGEGDERLIYVALKDGGKYPGED